ncbi:hypothetical protein PW52_14880 [Tamlana sedimentorum]|uniref:Uncharacterized protein n=1 Tax=Neotamlana sedimentorum TaxID=1435349 RepID=A0A0D7W158_9FLAO|nr:DUF6146 family protein [Tamlana sedimentorum]KJD32764.1 hypothetical protein PW52_14880 [Tamlana sedimentorum]
MRNLVLLIILCSAFIFNCNTQKRPISSKSKRLQNIKDNDTVKISSDKVEYEIIIIEPGYNYWLASTARPEGYYSQQFMESRNYQYVIEWNSRVLQPSRFSPNLYELQIDYQPNIDYGYEVNYKLYNYFIYFQLKYNQRLGSFTPRI